MSKKYKFTQKMQKRFKDALANKDWNKLLDFARRLDMPSELAEELFVKCLTDDETHQAEADRNISGFMLPLSNVPKPLRLQKREQMRYYCAVRFINCGVVDEDRAIELGFPVALIEMRNMPTEEVWDWIIHHHTFDD